MLRTCVVNGWLVRLTLHIVLCIIKGMCMMCLYEKRQTKKVERKGRISHLHTLEHQGKISFRVFYELILYNIRSLLILLKIARVNIFAVYIQGCASTRKFEPSSSSNRLLGQGSILFGLERAHKLQFPINIGMLTSTSIGKLVKTRYFFRFCSFLHSGSKAGLEQIISILQVSNWLTHQIYKSARINLSWVQTRRKMLALGSPNIPYAVFF